MSQTPAYLVAGGTVMPHRFVSPDASAEHQGIQATANSQIIGISGSETKFAPLEDLVSTNPHAETGDQIRLHGDGQSQILVEAGAAFTSGVRLKADANGKAVAAATSGTTPQEVGAISQQAAAAEGDLVLVQVALQSHSPA